MVRQLCRFGNGGCIVRKEVGREGLHACLEYNEVQYFPWLSQSTRL